jgi:epoxyqueuosine reductase
MHLEKRITDMAIAYGWDYCGFADLTHFHTYMRSFCGPFINQFPRAISLVIRLSNAVIDSIEEQERDKILSYHNYTYYAIDHLQNTGTARIANYLENQGWKAYPVPASYGVYQERLAALISHKLVARAAGLGWIGKNGLFLTPQEGPRVRLASILTDAPLETAQPMESACHNCQICQLACPAGAIKGREFNEREADDERLDPVKCFNFMENRKKEWVIEIERCVCGLCVAVCPFGKRHARL